MCRARLQFWVWLLLPFLVARALVPAGFMAQAVQGQLQMVFCTAGYSQPQADSAANQAGTVSKQFIGQQLVGQSHDKSQNDFSCPFAHAVAAPLVVVSGTDAIVYSPPSVQITEWVAPYYAVGPPRVRSVRGPPQV